ncbi:MAG TPA: serine O-acetyltransferase EpsC [Cryomorphaceae bacterium]|nr:serine O-acetyltransferase EpsC [Cryomorphaceae bacterium]
MERSFLEKLYKKNKDCSKCPSRERIGDLVDRIISFLFPDFEKREFNSFEAFKIYADQLATDLEYLLARNTDLVVDPPAVVASFFSTLPDLHQSIEEDLNAMLMGDPAAQSTTEIVKGYPGFYAISSYRIAHKLKNLGVELIPRIITEIAHSHTGIDIHPGAQIGKHFCIDHGTGVVIGETSLIGDNVKIYQGVTLGGLSVDKADAQKKRHPTIQDNVVIYAGATILGGETTIGKNSIIGGNVWLTRSVPEHTKVYYKAALTNNDGETDIIEFK